MTVTGIRRVGNACCCPSIGAWIVSAASVHFWPIAVTAPDDHLAARPDCHMIASLSGYVNTGSGSPVINAWAIFAAGVYSKTVIIYPAPDDHLTASPNCSMSNPRGRGTARGYPAVCASIVSPAGVGNMWIISAPNNHLIACPDCGVTVPGRGGIGDGNSCPKICTGIVFSACV